jgi:hypothetical protein
VADRGGMRLARLAAAALAFALAACSAGVPPNGEVVTVSPVPAGPQTPQVLDVDSGPVPGLQESDVARGYIAAMNTGRPETVARWVVPRAVAQVRRWSQPTTVHVYTSFRPEVPVIRGDGRSVVPVTVELAGRLEEGRQWEPATGEGTLELELRKVDAEWRVANPGDDLWMQDTSFKGLYAPAEMFMVAGLLASTPKLTPVPVFIRRAPDGTPPMRVLEQRVRSTLECLLVGPQGRYDNLSTAIPRQTRLRGFSYADGVATVDLTSQFAEPIGGSGQLRVGQVVWTVSRLIQTAQVRILVDGRRIGPLGIDRFQPDRLWQRTMQPLASLWPQRSSVAEGDRVLFVRGGELYTVPPEPGQKPQVLGLNAAGPKSAPSWSPNHKWIAFLLARDGSQVLWLVPPTGSAFPATNFTGRLSPPSWNPDSERLYVLSREGGQTRLWEILRTTLGVRPLELAPLPGGLQPTTLVVSPDGAYVLAVGAGAGAEPGDGGQLFVGRFDGDGVTGWFDQPIAPGFGKVFSPVWVDPVTVAFIAETESKDDLGRLWVMGADGWDPTAVIGNDTDDDAAVDIGTELTVDPAGANFIFTVRSESGASLWMVDRQGGNSVRPLTLPTPNEFDADPSFASR